MKNLFLVLSLALLSALLLVPQDAAAVQPVPQEEGAGCGAINLTVQHISGGDDWRIIVTGAQGGYIIRGTLGFDPSAPYVDWYGCDYLLASPSSGAIDSPILYGDVVFVVYNYGPSSPTLYLQALGVGETSGLGQLN